MEELNLDLVRHALATARRNGFAEVEIELSGDAFSAKLHPGVPPPAVAPSVEETSAEPSLAGIKATLVGYYREAKTPLRVGAKVQKGEVVAVIAALGIANDVESTVTGEVVEVLVQPEQPVEYGQILAKVKAS